MPQDPEITTFQFLEQIQKEFLQQMENGGSNGAHYDTRRIINFFNDTASLHILNSNGSNGSNGNGDHPLATLSLQQVAHEEEKPTFAINYQIEPENRLKKVLVVVSDESGMKNESSRILDMLKKDMENANAEASQEAPAPTPVPAEPVAEAPAPETAPPPPEVEASIPEEPVPAPVIEEDEPVAGTSAQDPAAEGSSVVDLNELTGEGGGSSERPRRRRRDRGDA